MYGNYLDDAAKIVAEKREENLKFEHARLTAEEKDDLLLKFLDVFFHKVSSIKQLLLYVPYLSD